MLSFCKRTVFVSDNIFFLLSCRAAIVDLAELTIGKLSETLNVPPVPPITSYLFSTVFRFSSGSSVLSSRFHPTLQTKDFLIFAYFLSKRKKRYVTQDAGLHYQ